MDSEITRDPENQKEDDLIHPLFFKKKTLSAEMKLELEKAKNAIGEQKERVRDLWDATLAVYAERQEANLSLNESLLQKEKDRKSEGSSSGTNKRGQKFVVAGIKFGPEEKDEAERFYNMWGEDYVKNALTQKEVIKDCVERWFEFLHQFDDTEPQPQTTKNKSPSWIYTFCCAFMLFVMYILFFCRPDGYVDYSEKCEDGILECFHEKFIGDLARIYDFYLEFHNITIDYSELSGMSDYIEVTDIPPNK